MPNEKAALHALHSARATARRLGWRETTRDRFQHPRRPAEVLRIGTGGFWRHSFAGEVRGRGSAPCLGSYLDPATPAAMIPAGVFEAMLARVLAVRQGRLGAD